MSTPHENERLGREFSRAKDECIAVRAALIAAAEIWRAGRKANVPERERRGLPHSHPRLQAFRTHSNWQSPEDREVTFPVLLSLYAQSVKQMFNAALRYNLASFGPRLPSERALVEGKLEGGESGALYAATLSGCFCDPIVPWMDQRECWEDGFRAGVKFARGSPLTPPSRRSDRSDQFWLTFAAFEGVELEEPDGTRRKLNQTGELIAKLRWLGVKERDGKLYWPTVKGGKQRPTSLAQFRNNLSIWRNDFQGMAQTLKSPN